MYPARIGPYPAPGEHPGLDQLLGGSRVSDREHLLQALIRVQQQLGWIPASYRQELSERCGVALAETLGVIDFYHFLEPEPSAPWQVHVSTNITDMMLGQQANLDALERYARSHPERLQVARTSCTGLCEQGPALLINGWAVGGVTPARLAALLERVDAGTPLAQWPDAWFLIPDQLRRRGPLLGHRIEPGAVLEQVRRAGREAFMAQLRGSGLLGRGGAGFPTAVKWQACIDAGGGDKVVACNADEGEPGTFKDRALLNGYLENVLEGMSICGEVIGASRGCIYLRKEYLFLHQPISRAIRRRREGGLLGRGFDIELMLGAGAYVCGEESAMLDSAEGRRGIPRIRPPFPVERGFLGRPTVVNNVETLCNITLLADRGVEAFTAVGTAHAPGSKLHSMSGDCARPGVYEFPLGATVGDMLAACGGEDAGLVQVGGAAGRLVGRDDFDLAIDYRQLNSAGSFMVFGPRRRPEDLLVNFSRFFAEESCGFCTPCRGGSQMLAHYGDLVDGGGLIARHRETLLETCALMMAASHCGLGKTAGSSIGQIVRDFIPARAGSDGRAEHGR